MMYSSGGLAEVFSPLYKIRWKENASGFFYIEADAICGIHSWNDEHIACEWIKDMVIPEKYACVEKVWLSGRIEVGKKGYISHRATLFKRKEESFPENYFYPGAHWLGNENDFWNLYHSLKCLERRQEWT